MQECQPKRVCYNEVMEEKINFIKQWIGTGSINIFGLPMSGKDTVGMRLAEALGAKFLSSGLIIRAVEKDEHKDLTSRGILVPTEAFYEMVLPYFEREDLKAYPLVLSSVGRWFGEELKVIETAKKTEHPLKVVVALNISEVDVTERWEVARTTGDRGERSDDNSLEVFKTRIEEFKLKTLPVLMRYQQMGMLVSVQADQTREQVFQEVVEKIYQYAQAHPNKTPAKS